MKTAKIQGQEQKPVEQSDGLERNGFCDFDKPHKCACLKTKTESNKQSKEAGCQTESKAFGKSIVERIVQKSSLGLLNLSKMN